MTRATLTTVGTSFVACLALMACSTSDDPSTEPAGTSDNGSPLSDEQLADLVREAQAEGSLTLYGVPGEETMRAWVSEFEAEYGIEVEIYRATVSDIQRRFTEESSAGRHLADVVSMSVPAYIEDAVDQGYAVPYRTQSYDDIDPALITVDTGYPMYAVITAIAWNENEVSQDLQARLIEGDYSALLDEELAGRVGVVPPTAGGTQLGSHLAIVNDPDLGWDYLDSLLDEGAALFESSVPFVANDLASGEYAAGIGVPDSVAIPRIYAGAPIRISYPDPAPASMHQFFLSANAPNSAAARLFMEWGTSLEAQTSIANITGGLVGHLEWQDEREISSTQWYTAPVDGIDVEWQESLTMDDSDEFITEWLERLG